MWRLEAVGSWRRLLVLMIRSQQATRGCCQPGLRRHTKRLETVISWRRLSAPGNKLGQALSGLACHAGHRAGVMDPGDRGGVRAGRLLHLCTDLPCHHALWQGREAHRLLCHPMGVRPRAQEGLGSLAEPRLHCMLPCLYNRATHGGYPDVPKQRCTLFKIYALQISVG